MKSTVDQVTQRRRGTGLIAHDPSLSWGGYTLIAPQTGGGKVYLIDIEGKVAHEWQMPTRAGRHAVILANGNLGYNGSHAGSASRYAPWSMWHGGDFSEVTPGGEVVWHYEDPAHHHDAQWLPNGNLLYAACELTPAGFAQRVPGGTAHAPGEPMYGDVIREVNRSGEMVWEWKAWEHLDPQDFPIHPGFGRYHWPLVNGLGVMQDGTVLMSLRTTIGESRKTGFNPTFLGSSAVYTDLIHKLGGKAMDGLYGAMTVQHPYLDDASPAIRFWAAKYKTKFNEDPTVFSVYGYSVIDQFIKAANRAGPTLTTNTFIKAMDGIAFEPDMFGSPRSNYTATKRLGNDLSRLSQIQDGKWKPVSGYLKP